VALVAKGIELADVEAAAQESFALLASFGTAMPGEPPPE
jgi:hypothetical protein